jgi:hypothetical protein
MDKYGPPQIVHLVGFRCFWSVSAFHVFGDLAILYLPSLLRKVHLRLCLLDGQGKRYEPIAAL